MWPKKPEIFVWPFTKKHFQEIIIKLTPCNHYLGQEVKYFQYPGNLCALLITTLSLYPGNNQPLF